MFELVKRSNSMKTLVMNQKLFCEDDHDIE